MKKQILVALVKYGLGIGLLAWVVWRYWDLPSNGEEVGLAAALRKPINTAPLLLAGGFYLVGILITFVRWYILVRAQGLPFTLPNALRLGLIGFYLSTFLPGSVGGDIIKAACIARGQSRRTVAVATVLLDRAIGLCGLFWLVTLLGSLFWTGGYLQDLAVSAVARTALETILLGAASLTAASLCFWLVLGVLPARRVEIFAGRLTRIPKAGHALAEFWRAVWMYRCRGRSVLLALVLAMAGHVGFVLSFYFAARTLSAASAIPSLGAHFLIVPVGMAFEAGFPAPGGVGGGEYGYGTLYGFLGFAVAAGVLMSLVRRVITWILGLTGYLVYLRMGTRLGPTPAEACLENTPAPLHELAAAAEQATV